MEAMQAVPRALWRTGKQNRRPGFLPALTFALLLSACGGAGVNSTPAPPVSIVPPPPPPPPPAPKPPPPPSGALGLSGGPFITTAAEFDGITGAWPNEATANVVTSTNLVTITHMASDDSYTISLPAYGSGKLVFDGGSGSFNNSTAWLSYAGTSYKLMDGGIERPVIFGLRYPPRSELTYTSTGTWNSKGNEGPRRQGVFAYGIPTAAGTMPTTGTASFAATVEGFTRTNNPVWGTADFQFDLGAGSLAGSMTLESTDGWDPVGLGRFTFIDTVYSSGSTSFGGRLTVPDSTDKGSFSGHFTGPGGVELLGSFQTPAWHPFFKRWEDIAGILKGKRK